jgi:hypothetical protein
MAQEPRPTANPTLAEVLVRDPLSAVTRKERLYLLAVSMIGIAMVRTGLVPSKIATFGIELDPPNRSALLFLLALVTVYFLAAFIVYAASDYIARRAAISMVGESELANVFDRVARKYKYPDGRTLQGQYEAGTLRGREPEAVQELDNDLPQYSTVPGSTQLMAAIRLFFEFILPLLVGMYAIYTLLSRAIG